MAVFNMLKIWLVYAGLAILHELAHFIVAKRLGYKLGRIKLMPFGAVLEAENDEFLPKDEIVVSLIGPIFNLTIWFLIVALWWIKPEIYSLTLDLAVANLSLALFNLVPIYPLDGGRVVLAILSKNGDRKWAAKIMRIASVLFGIMLILLCFASLFLSFNLTIGVVGLMILSSAFSSGNELRYKRILGLSAKRKKLEVGLPIKRILMSENATIFKAYRKLSYAFYSEIVVVDSSFQECGKINETALINLMQGGAAALTLKDGIKMCQKFNY